MRRAVCCTALEKTAPSLRLKMVRRMSSCHFFFCYIEVSLVITAFSRDFPRHYTLSVWLICPRTTSFSLSCYAFFTLNSVFWILGDFVATPERQKHPRSFKGFHAHPQTHTPYVTVRVTVPAPNPPSFSLLVPPLFDFLSPSFVPFCSPRDCEINQIVFNSPLVL